MTDLTDAELDRLVERLNETDWGKNVADTLTRWDHARRDAAATITALRARIAEDQAQIAALTTYRENLRDEVIELRARIAELEADRAKWVGEREESIRRGARRTPGRFRL